MKVSESEIRNASILIVDDQLSNVELLHALLVDAGYTKIHTTMDPTEVCELHRKNSYDLILLDLQMPVMDGCTLTRNIKQDGRFKGIPVIIHSSLTGAANEGHVKSVGADAYIAKFVAEELGNTIRSVLARR